MSGIISDITATLTQGGGAKDLDPEHMRKLLPKPHNTFSDIYGSCKRVTFNSALSFISMQTQKRPE
jgi:hypothetical protein